jgi:hypothetical protein
MIFTLSIVALLVTWGLVIHTMTKQLIVPAAVDNIVRRIRTDEENELVKKYAAMFGLDNEAHEINVAELIEMGRKYEEYLGSDVIDSIAEQHVNFYASMCSRKPAATGRVINKPRRHRINKMIKRREILAHITCLAHTVFIQIITGGNKDGEPSTSTN